MRLALLRLDPFATERGRAAFPVDDRQLAPIAVRRCGDNCVHRLLGCEAVLYEIKCEWSQARVGSMLRQCCSDAGAGERAAGTDRKVVTTAPSIPVRVQRPSSEKVIDRPPAERQ